MNTIKTLLIGGLAFAGLANPAFADGTTNLKAAEVFLAANKKKSHIITTKSGLEYKVIKLGKGIKPTTADSVRVNYKGFLANGTVFDQSKEPIEFGVTQVIPGWTEAVQLMPVGSKYRLWVHPALAYGENSPSPMIPPNSMLIFDVELLGIPGK